MRYKYTKEELEKAVKESLSIAEVCRKLNIRDVCVYYKTLNDKIKKFQIDNSHFTGSAWNQGERYKPLREKRPLSEILVENSDYLTSHHLRLRLIEEGVKEHKCEGCGLTEWRGQKISLELEHKNGNNLDHRIENLEVLCPNCHSQTPTYRGKNKGVSQRNEIRRKS